MNRSRFAVPAGTNIFKLAAMGMGVTALSVAIYWPIPPNTIGLLCTHRLQYRLDAVLKVGEEVIESTVVHQLAQPRKWIGSLQSCNSAGEAIAFKSKDDRVFIIDSNICRNAENQFPKISNVDIINYCSSFWKNKLIGFEIDSASAPRSWRKVNFLNERGSVKLISMSAVKTLRHPYSNINDIAPNISKTFFDDGGEWSSSPANFTSSKQKLMFRAVYIRG